jgi:outer membrane receptor for ferrienterochelin and colicin
MLRTTKLNRIAIAVAMSMGMATAAFAQETSSGISGKIVGPQGTPAAGTVITITHIPSGTTKTATVNQAGQFSAKGLRVGGPYSVKLDSDKFQDTQVNDLYLNLGEAFSLDLALEDKSNVESIVVTGQRVLFNSSANDSYFGAEDILNAPSLNRDIKDIVRGNPLVNISPGGDRQMSIAGSNPRFNSISVGGIPLNDDFGLNGGGYPTQRNPFPLEALDQLSVEIAPTNAKVSGFTGGGINAVFKSGTNEFHGNVFYEKLSDGIAGTPKNNGVEIPLDFEEKNYGFSVGGPLIENKLFFFAAYEFYESPQSLEYGPAGSGIGSNEANVTVSDITAIQEIANRVYGASDIGAFDTQPQLEDEKYIVKVDWNINQDHRASFVYMFNDGNSTRNATTNSNELRLDTHWYDNTQELQNFAATLYSDWNDDFSSEVSFTQKSVETGQVSLKAGLGLADITINNVDTDGDGTKGSVAFGSDESRHSNSLSNDLTILKFDGTYLLDEHTVEFGIDYQILEVENQYLPGARGVVTFDNIVDFENQIANRYSYTNGTGNNPLAAAAAFERENLSLYINDSWYMTDDLSLSFGLRYERFSSDDKPTANPGLLARTGFDNTFNLDGTDIILPRFGFTYSYSDGVTIKGSIGKYAGGNPNVWISNSYSNDGVSTQSYSLGRNQVLTIPSLTTPPPEAIAAINNGTGTTVSNLLDPNFNIPSQWTYMLNSDVELDIPGIGEGFAWTTTAIYTDKQDSAEWINAALLQEGDVVGQSSSGALPFYDTRELDILLTNADEDGRSVILSTGLSKDWDNGFNMDMSYTNQDITEGNPGTSSTARSNYRYGHFLDHQQTQVATSTFETEHRFVLNIGYKNEFFDGYATRINVFFERRSGSPYSQLVDLVGLQGSRFNDQDLIQPSGFGTTFGGNYTAYVPTANDPNVIYTGATEAEVLAFFDEQGLSGYAGRHVDKNQARTPWQSTMDLFVSQEVPGFMEGHKGEVYLVVNNFLNMIDSSAGKVYSQGNSTSEVIQMDINETTGQYIYGDFVDDGLNFEAEDSTWRVKVGLKYSF